MSADLDRIPLDEALLMCFDLETTGVNINEDRIVQLAVSYFHKHRVVQQHTQIFNPGVPIPEGASAVHGVYDAHVVDQPKLADFIPRLAPHFRGEVLAQRPPPLLVGYNLISFDVPLFKAELSRVGHDSDLIEIPTLDLIIFVRWFLRHRRHQRLENICQDFGVSLTKAHDALFDAKACGYLVSHFLRSGYLPTTVGEALKAQAHFASVLEQEYQDYRRWLYRDRTTQALTMGQGKHIGVGLAHVDPSYLTHCLNTMSDLPPMVREAFTSRLKGAPLP